MNGILGAPTSSARPVNELTRTRKGTVPALANEVFWLRRARVAWFRDVSHLEEGVEPVLLKTLESRVRTTAVVKRPFRL